MKRTFIMGDIHGNATPIQEIVQSHPTLFSNSEKHYMILLGDTGLNFWFDKRDQKIKQELSKLPFIYFIVRGNHEERPSNCMKMNPSKWIIEDFFGNAVLTEKDFPNIKYAMDNPSIYTIPINEEKFLKTLVMGGAYSIDKMFRIQNNWPWFPDEQMTPEEMIHAQRLITQEGKIDLILTHTCPSTVQPKKAMLQRKNIQDVNSAMERFFNGLYVNSLYKKCETFFRVWLFGHYHIFKDYLRSKIPTFTSPRFLALDGKYAVDLASVITDCISVI